MVTRAFISFRDKMTHFLHRGEDWLFANPKIVLAIVGIITAAFAWQVPKLQIFSDFNDLLPQKHPYIQVYNRMKENFGGANSVIMAIEVEKGTIFNEKTLALIHKATQGVDNLPSVNHNLVSSIAHRTVRKVSLSPEGGFVSELYYDSQEPSYTPERLAKLQADILADPAVYGLLVSPDLKAALVRGQLNEGNVDYPKFFNELKTLRDSLASPGHKIYVTGNPVLTAWVYTYLPEMVSILAWTAVLLATLLILYYRRLYGIALPILGIALSTLWGLGFMAAMGINLEPLSLPIPFLIAARAMSHGTQLVSRYYEELDVHKNAAISARKTLEALFRPGSLAIIVDAIGITVLMLGTAPFNTKLGAAAGFWGFSVIFTVHFMIPLALSVLPQPKKTVNGNVAVREALGAFMRYTGGTTTGARVILLVTFLGMAASYVYISHVQIGESEPGSPLLARDHDFNLSTKAINERFPGSEELNIIIRTDEAGGIKKPEVMAAIERFQAHMMSDPTVGGTRALPIVVRVFNRLTHSDDPRWMQTPSTGAESGGLMFAFMASSPIPGALKEFITPEDTEANLVFYYKDHQATTITRAAAMALEGKKMIEAEVPGVHVELAGGIVGVNAAGNQALHRDHMIIIPSVLLLSFLLVAVYYQSLHAGWLMILPMLFATAMTYAYMGWKNIGINVNTVPVITVGVGVGIDYAVYFMDRIREEFAHSRDIHKAVINAVATTGYAVSFTATTLIAGVILWIFMSSLRFQSDTAVLLSFMLIVNAIAAMFIVPAWCVVFKPHFVTHTEVDADGVIQEKV